VGIGERLAAHVFDEIDLRTYPVVLNTVERQMLWPDTDGYAL
jgi:hypothetical protein